MGKLYAACSALGVCVLLAGCGREYDGDQRFPLSGTASFNGEPIDLGSITLVPTGGGTETGGGTATSGRASGGTIMDGKYVIPEEKGPNAGMYRVEVRWLKKTGRELKDPESGEMYDERIEALPEKFHRKSELTVEIPAAEDTHNLELKAG